MAGCWGPRFLLHPACSIAPGVRLPRASADPGSDARLRRQASKAGVSENPGGKGEATLRGSTVREECDDDMALDVDPLPVISRGSTPPARTGQAARRAKTRSTSRW